MDEAEANTAVQALPEMMSANVEALLEAARYDDMDDVVILASNGVPLDSKDEQALHMAAANGHIEIVEYLIGQGVDLNVANEEKNTPLHWACLNGHVEVVKKLIMAGANVGVLNSHERTPMDEAVTRGKLEVMDAINEAVALVELRCAMVSTQEPSS
ncbi:ankyrin repeat-containing protein P16F5.05c isoform X2 [Arachis duranensis]|uniref:Ankyrin repeat-containing protein P16F5.05c isoform X2 n=1 Tax=Arachis duranensis TaxID=130453 RepID=A0A9C6TIH8_ARADU|nr:ankyrin repeat-containing protein P16F5.05c-like isoform X2 [Arachis hypogaea]XP_025677205.1 ankyrin repeat-containing protein P16F5.05c-like isoform X2 [Arachis hypogaea]XP_052109583.1 ankyrin repeat-containing protein P16F5.05c isoform X2 [Arachis duranensis]XP_057732277.1 ankyrin repeat-containing protein P16F5.05c isoform X2 [Arachis stenosperma]XP_057732278.1 ankyrin repeat-containing protein P16F5.05c isoform X2 [Arachis stenosperma]